MDERCAPDALTDDALTAEFRVWQRRRGHRYSLDDVLTAWQALQEFPRATRVLDLGCGIGSVLLMMASRLPDARMTGVEAQSGSMQLARCNVTRNGVGNRVALVEGDLRDPDLLGGLAGVPFDLVTGTPPYQPPGTATPSPDPQRAHARIEMRGGVEDYLRAAARVVGKRGRIVVCADARRPERVLTSATEAGLRPLRRRDAIPRAGAGALFSVWTLGPEGSVRATVPSVVEFVARDADGRRTDAYRSVRAFFGLPGVGGAGRAQAGRGTAGP